MIKLYQVAEHTFSIEANEDFPFWSIMEERYGPFEVSDIDTKYLFHIVIDEQINCDEKVLLYTNQGNTNDEFVTFSVYKLKDNSHYFELTQPRSKEINGVLYFNENFSSAILKLSGPPAEQWLTFNTVVNLCFHIASSSHNTLLLHSSAVIYKERAYLFLGKSGTGKSTHSRMWLNALNGVILMNDDHPIVRVYDDNIIAYGSPWSGKTHCYKNIHAPLGGIIRIIRASHNKAIRLSPIQAYASIMPSCGGLVWEKEYADNRNSTIQSVISRIPNWNMECLPNEDAAKVCSKAVTEVWDSL